MGITICFINQKGGCGKSSTCFHLAGHLAQSGLRVLLIDADPQGSLNQGILGSNRVESLEPSETLATLFREDAFASLATLATNTPIVNIQIVPANQHLAAWNTPSPEDFGTQGLRAVLQAIGQAGQLNPKLTLLGLLVTRMDRRLLVHRAYEQKLRRLYGETVFETVVPEAAAFKAALACRQPVSHYSPRSGAAAAMAAMATELQDRMHRQQICRSVA